jgi:hypothetical protein
MTKRLDNICSEIKVLRREVSRYIRDDSTPKGLDVNIKRIEMELRRIIALQGKDRYAAAFSLIDLLNIKESIILKEKHPNYFIDRKNEIVISSLCLWPYSALYKDVRLESPVDDLPSLIRFNEDYSDVVTLIDVLAYIYARPLFPLTEDEEFDDKYQTIYDTLVEIQQDMPLGIVPFREIVSDVFFVPSIKYPLAFSLYNSALKQVDPLARCLFLFRIVEYYGENILKKGKNEWWSAYMERIYEKAMMFSHLPLIHSKDGHRHNLIVAWKSRSKAILKRKSVVRKDYFKDIYLSGRTAVAHGKRPSELALHNHEGFSRVSEYNIFLQLICRYLVEKYNNVLCDCIKPARTTLVEIANIETGNPL